MKLIRLSLVFLFFIFSSINAQDFLNTPPKLIGDQFGFTEGFCGYKVKIVALYRHSTQQSLQFKYER